METVCSVYTPPSISCPLLSPSLHPKLFHSKKKNMDETLEKTHDSQAQAIHPPSPAQPNIILYILSFFRPSAERSNHRRLHSESIPPPMHRKGAGASLVKKMFSMAGIALRSEAAYMVAGSRDAERHRTGGPFLYISLPIYV